MGVDPQGYIGRGVAKPLADRHDVDTGIDQLRRMRMSQAVQGDLWQAESVGD
jgi:hypothetical protein